MKILITSGGTKVKIDSVRHIANMSSGTFGSRIASEALQAGHEVIFLKAKNSKSPMLPELIDGMSTDDLEKEFKKCLSFREKYGARSIDGRKFTEFTYSEFEEYSDNLKYIINLFEPDVIVLAAAVSDYGIANPMEGKIRSKSDLTLNLTPLPKVISTVRDLAPKAIIVGFKLLVNSTKEELIEAADKSLMQNKLDLVVANDLRDIKNNDHALYLVSVKDVNIYRMNSYNLAQFLVRAITGIKR